MRPSVVLFVYIVHKAISSLRLSLSLQITSCVTVPLCFIVQCAWPNPSEGCAKLQMANLYCVLTSHLICERCSNNSDFSIARVLPFDVMFCFQGNIKRREQLKKQQKSLQAVHRNEVSFPWIPPGKVTYTKSY